MIWQPVHSIFQNVVLFSWKYLIGQLCVGHPSDSMKLHCHKNNISFHYDNICLYIPNAHKMHARILLKRMLRCICHICACFLFIIHSLKFFLFFFPTARQIRQKQQVCEMLPSRKLLSTKYMIWRRQHQKSSLNRYIALFSVFSDLILIVSIARCYSHRSSWVIDNFYGLSFDTTYSSTTYVHRHYFCQSGIVFFLFSFF